MLAIAAPAALAQSDYVHDSASCNQCHPNGTGAPGTDAACQACHTNFLLHPGSDCWTCHKPGVAPGTTQAACTGVCHMWTGPDTYSQTGTTPHGATPHLGSNLEPCTTCHKTSVSDTNPGQSPHHSGEAAPEAPTCTNCHTTPKFDNAPAPHPPLAASPPPCETCHVGVSPTHPPASQMIKPTLTIGTAPGTNVGDVVVSGTLMNGASGLGNVHVFLQVKLPGAADFAPLAEVNTAADGSYTHTVSAATAGAFYRAISEGEANTGVVMPAIASTERVKATLTLKLSKAIIKLHKSVTATGKLGPVSLAGSSVKVLIQKKKGTKWVRVKPPVSKATNATTGAYSLKFKPSTRGTYRMQSSIAKTALHTAAKSPFRSFKVR
jgi:hypothetical protein